MHRSSHRSEATVARAISSGLAAGAIASAGGARWDAFNSLPEAQNLSSAPVHQGATPVKVVRALRGSTFPGPRFPLAAG